MEQQPLTIEEARATFLSLAQLWSARPLDMALRGRLDDAAEDLWEAAERQRKEQST